MVVVVVVCSLVMRAEQHLRFSSTALASREAEVACSRIREDGWGQGQAAVCSTQAGPGRRTRSCSGSEEEEEEEASRLGARALAEVEVEAEAEALEGCSSLTSETMLRCSQGPCFRHRVLDRLAAGEEGQEESLISQVAGAYLAREALNWEAKLSHHLALITTIILLEEELSRPARKLHRRLEAGSTQEEAVAVVVAVEPSSPQQQPYSPKEVW